MLSFFLLLLIFLEKKVLLFIMYYRISFFFNAYCYFRFIVFFGLRNNLLFNLSFRLFLKIYLVNFRLKIFLFIQLFCQILHSFFIFVNFRAPSHPLLHLLRIIRALLKVFCKSLPRFVFLAVIFAVLLTYRFV
jgi:hypothetical protein